MSNGREMAKPVESDWLDDLQSVWNVPLTPLGRANYRKALEDLTDAEIRRAVDAAMRLHDSPKMPLPGQLRKYMLEPTSMLQADPPAIVECDMCGGSGWRPHAASNRKGPLVPCDHQKQEAL